MKTPLYLYHPLNTLKPVGPNLWIADGDLIHMAFPLGLKVPFSTRMTVVRLSDGGLWCHSPIAPSPALQAEIDALGPVRHLVSPNRIHYAHIPAWAARYPAAKTWASPGVRERAASQHIAVAFSADLDDRAPPDWAIDLEQLAFAGSWAMTEMVFFHRASRSLILTDLIENFETDKFASPAACGPEGRRCPPVASPSMTDRPPGPGYAGCWTGSQKISFLPTAAATGATAVPPYARPSPGWNNGGKRFALRPAAFPVFPDRSASPGGFLKVIGWPSQISEALPPTLPASQSSPIFPGPYF